MNEKGQTLVLFLFLLPIILILFMGVYQLGNLELEKKKMESAVEETLRYGLLNIEKESIKDSMVEMFQRSFPEISSENITIEIAEDKINMQVEEEYSIIFIDKQVLKISYGGEKINGKVQIVKE